MIYLLLIKNKGTIKWAQSNFQGKIHKLRCKNAILILQINNDNYTIFDSSKNSLHGLDMKTNIIHILVSLKLSLSDLIHVMKSHEKIYENIFFKKIVLYLQRCEEINEYKNHSERRALYFKKSKTHSETSSDYIPTGFFNTYVNDISSWTQEKCCDECRSSQIKQLYCVNHFTHCSVQYQPITSDEKRHYEDCNKHKYATIVYNRCTSCDIMISNISFSHDRDFPLVCSICIKGGFINQLIDKYPNYIWLNNYLHQPTNNIDVKFNKCTFCDKYVDVEPGHKCESRSSNQSDIFNKRHTFILRESKINESVSKLELQNIMFELQNTLAILEYSELAIRLKSNHDVVFNSLNSTKEGINGCIGSWRYYKENVGYDVSKENLDDAFRWFKDEWLHHRLFINKDKNAPYVHCDLTCVFCNPNPIYKLNRTV